MCQPLFACRIVLGALALTFSSGETPGLGSSSLPGPEFVITSTAVASTQHSLLFSSGILAPATSSNQVSDRAPVRLDKKRRLVYS